MYVANTLKYNGFGLSVIQRLCKTSVKKNLYWEIKDKVIEEAFDGFRMRRDKHKVKVYGTNSTKDVRARLIDILRERVMYHKDKFVAPILHEEMSAMEVKTNGKVEHSANSHDDQVFSYLMALYVWYDGKNLAQNYGIVKNTLKTDDAEEIEELDFENELEHRETIDTRKLEQEESEFDKQLNFDLEWLEHDAGSFKTADQFAEQQQQELANLKKQFYSSNPKLIASINDEFGVHLINPQIPNNFVQLPDSMFTGGLTNEEINFDDWDGYGLGGNRKNDAAHQPSTGPKLVGNLSNIFAKM